jgi:hypothetical protein
MPKLKPGQVKKEDRYDKLWRETDKDYTRWMDKLNSKVSQSNYLRRMIALNEKLKLTPQSIVQAYEASGKTRKDLIDDLDAYITSEIKAGHYGTAYMTWATVVSLLRHRGVLMSAKLFEIKQPKSDIVEPQYIPTHEEYMKMLRYATCARDRFVVAFLRYSGGRIGVVDDPVPLKLANVLDLDFEALTLREIKFKHASSCAILFYAEVREDKIVRYRETYVSFMLPEAMQLLREYLEERIRKNEELTASSYLFGPEREESEYLNHKRLSYMITELSKNAGYTIKNQEGDIEAKFTAHSLRRLFYNSLQGLDDVDRECLNGRISGIRARYHGSVDELPKVVEFMRQRYEFAMRALISTATAEEQRKKSVIDYARMQGLKEEEIRKVQEAIGFSCSAEELREALAQVLETRRESKTAERAKNGGRAYEALMISDQELISYIEEGWEMIKELSNGKIVVRRRPN